MDILGSSLPAALLPVSDAVVHHVGDVHGRVVVLVTPLDGLSGWEQGKELEHFLSAHNTQQGLIESRATATPEGSHSDVSNETRGHERAAAASCMWR
jgi:hypothetical protein